MSSSSHNLLFSTALSKSIDAGPGSDLHFKVLPDYARYIHEQRFADFIRIQYDLARAMHLPLLGHFDRLSDEAILALAEEGMARMLSALYTQSVPEFYAAAVNSWINGQMQGLSRHQIVSDDITILGFVRRKGFRDLLPDYTHDIVTGLRIMEEVDLFLTEFESILYNTLLEIQNELHEQAERIAQIGNWLWDLSNNSIFWSKELFRIYDLEPQEVVTFDIAAFNHPDDAERVREQMRRSRETGEPHDFYYRIVLPSGVEKHLHAIGQVVTNEQGEVVKMFGTLQDVTESVLNASIIRAQSEEMSLQEERHFKMIEEVEEYAILLLSKDAIIENWNRGAEKIKGYAAHEIIGKHFRTFYTPADQESGLPEKLIAEAVRNGRATHEGWRVRKNGEQFWAYVVITALHDKDGNVIGFSKVTRDLTGKKLAEDMLLSYTRQLEEKNEQLAAKNKELESFAYIASHDLQEPLRKIRLWVDRLGDIGSLPENAKSATAKITGSTEKMQALIRGLLNYVQTDDARGDFVTEDLGLLVKEILNDYAELLDEKKAVLQVGALPVLPVIPVQMRQLFSNLVSNAIKYSNPDRPLRISITGETLPTSAGETLPTSTGESIPPGAGETIPTSIGETLSPGTQDAKPFVQVIFSDNGIGFPQDQAETIFELFKRLGGSEVSGTGIGLAICRKIVHNHGGSIRAESQPGAGTSFIISLPAAANNGTNPS